MKVQTNALYAGRGCSAAALTLVLCVSNCLASESNLSDGWREECAGRLMFLVPGDTEAAVNGGRSLEFRLRGLTVGIQEGSTYNDDAAGWMGFYGPGIHWVSPKLTAEEIDALRKRWNEQIEKSIKLTKGETGPDGKRYDFSPIYIGRNTVQAVRSTKSFKFRVTFGDRVVDGDFPMTMTTPQAEKAYVAQMMDNVRPREAFDVPRQAGLCYPYFFIKDDGTISRDISMSYRSKARPDVHFVLHDATPDEQDSARPRDVTNPLHWFGGEADRQIVFHWDQRSIVGTIKPAWLSLARSVTLAGRLGRESLVELTRRDNGTVEYEYFAYARGDPKSSEDTPDISLYVYTHMDYGKSKGLAPITKKEFLAIAQAVAASVKRRPVQ